MASSRVTVTVGARNLNLNLLQVEATLTGLASGSPRAIVGERVPAAVRPHHDVDVRDPPKTRVPALPVGTYRIHTVVLPP